MLLSSDEIRESADLLLRQRLKEIFTTEETKLSVSDFNTQSDRGIDLVFEIIDRASDTTKLKFNVQNKGVEKSKNVKRLKTNRNNRKGYISYKLEKIRHIPYYLAEIAEPIVITLCDLENREVYWHPIQLDLEIEGRAMEQMNQNKDSIQIYVNPTKKLTLENSAQFFEDLERSKIEQNIKYNYKDLAPELSSKSFSFGSSTSSGIENLHKALNLFGHFELVPKYLIARQYPFSISSENIGYCNGSTLITPNLELFEELRELTIKCNKSIKLETFEEEVLTFLNQNLIYHIETTRRKQGDRICIHDLLVNKPCNCIRCSYKRMDFLSILPLISADSNKMIYAEKIKQLYIFYKLGLYERAFKLMKDLAEQAYRENHQEVRYLIFYNLKRFSRVVWSNFFSEKGNKIIDYIKNVNLDEEFDQAKHQVNPDLYNALKWVHEDRFFYRPFYRIHKIVNEIINKVNTDQRGGWTSDNKEQELLIEFAHFISFMELTPIFYDRFTEFNDIIHKVFEGLVAPNKILREETRKTTILNRFVVHKLIHYGSADRLLQVLQDYDIEIISISKEDDPSSINQIAENLWNLANSFESIKTIIKYEDGQVNYHLTSDLRRIIQNSLVLFSYCQFEENEVSKVVDCFLQVFISQKLVKWDKKYFNHFVSRMGDKLESAHLEKIIKVVSKDLVLINEVNIVQIVGKLSKRNYELSKIPSLGKILKALLEDQSNSYFQRYSILVNLYEYVDGQQRQEVRKVILERLNNRFDTDLYYRAVVNRVVDYKSYFQDFIQRIPKSTEESSIKELVTGRKDSYNYRLNQLVQICYMNEMKIPVDLHPPTDYYQWLFDPENFDYEKFDVSWLLEFKVRTYLERFSKIPKIKEAVEAFLRKSTHKDLSQLYFNHLI